MQNKKEILSKNTDTTLEDLYKNVFVQTVMNENTKKIKKLLKDDPSLEKKDGRSKMSDKEKFIVDTFSYMSEIMTKIQTLDYCPAFLNSYPKRKMWEKTFSRSDYIKYHIEAYLNNLTGVFDRCLLLVNYLFDLGYPKKYVKFETISANSHLEKESVKKALELFNKGLEKVKPLRNFVNHQGRLSDQDLDKVGEYEFLMRSGSKFTKRQKNFLLAIIKLGFSSYIRNMKKQLGKSSENLFKLCNAFFNALFKKYIERLNSY